MAFRGATCPFPPTSTRMVVQQTTSVRNKSSIKLDEGLKTPKKVKAAAKQVFPPDESTPLLGSRKKR